MRKLLLSLSVFIILGSPKVLAQIIPNLGFETWTADPYSTNNAPDPNNGIGTAGWWEFNIASNSYLGNPASPLTVFKDSANPSPENGKYYAAVVSETMSSTPYNDLKTNGFIYPQTNGLLFTGYVNINTSPLGIIFKNGIPCKNSLQSFSFYYRYVPNGSDSCSCTIAMYHWNSKAKNRTLLGGGFWGSVSTQTAWKAITVPILYSADSIHVTPDTILIVFSACAKSAANTPKTGDTLDIDNGSIVLGIDNITAEHDNVILYPNPANTQINLAVSGQFQATRVEIYDITGKAVGAYTIHNNFLTINTQSLGSGLYLYRLLDDDGTQLNVGKFSVIR